MISDSISLLEIWEINMLSLGTLELGISLLIDVVSLYVSDIWVDNISDSNSLLEIWELDILGTFVLGISLLNDSFVVSLYVSDI